MVDVVYIEFVQRDLVPREIIQIVPSHRIDICLSDFFGKLGLSLCKETKDTSIPEETILLYDLSVDTGRA
jgi:hypothetical protein